MCVCVSVTLSVCVGVRAPVLCVVCVVSPLTVTRETQTRKLSENQWCFYLSFFFFSSYLHLFYLLYKTYFEKTFLFLLPVLTKEVEEPFC